MTHTAPAPASTVTYRSARAARAAVALADGFRTAQAQKDALADVTAAYDIERSHICGALLGIDRADRSPEWGNLYYDLPHYPHQWKAKHTHAYHDFPVEVAEIAKLVDLRSAIKAAPVTKAAPKAPVVASLVTDEGARLTCQCCGRPILANTGRIAHHGYTRPGWGYQTSSCAGAGHLPFEASSDALADYVAQLRNWVAGAESKAYAVRIGIEQAALWVSDYDAPRGARGDRKKVELRCGPDSYHEVLASHPKTLKTLGINSWQTFKDACLSKLEALRDSYEQELGHQQARLNAWEGPTLAWDRKGKAWVAL